MQALEWTGTKAIRTIEVPRPEPGPGEVAIRVEATGICGSDIHAYLGKHRFRRPPAVLGHELAGVVEAVGASVDELQVGQRVTVMPVVSCGTCDLCRSGQPHLCRQKVVPGTAAWPGTFADYFNAPASVTLRLPGELDAEVGALIEPIAVGVHAVRQAGDITARDILVLGAGPIGHLVALAARFEGGGRIVCVDPDAVAQQTGRENGFDVAGPERLADLGTFDVTFVTANYQRSIDDALGATKPGGRVVVVAMYGDRIPVDIYGLVFDEITVRGSMIYRLEDFHRAIELAVASRTELRRVVGVPRPLRDGGRAFQEIVDGRRSVLKTLLHPGD